MVHGVRIAGGRAEWYRNRFVQTPNITDPDGGDVMTNMADLTRGTANTHVLAHNKKLLCLEEGPLAVDDRHRTQHARLRELRRCADDLDDRSSEDLPGHR